MYYDCTLNVAATFVKFAMLPPMISTFPVKDYFEEKKNTYLNNPSIHTVLGEQSSYLQGVSLWSSETG